MFKELVQTKIRIPPLRTQVIGRSRLIQRLDAAKNQKLTLLSAPAGFGKTTLLSDWAKSQPEDIAWLSLDEEDNDLISFWTYFVAAIQNVYPNIGLSAMQMLDSPSGIPVKAVVKILINEIFEKQESVILVLDDFHQIEEDTVCRIFKFFIDYMPYNMHLVVASRHELPLSVGRLKIQGQYAAVNADDLRFTADEAAAFARQVSGRAFTDDEVAALAEYCEGWAAGLQVAVLAADTDKTGGKLVPNGMQSHIIDYFVDEVFSSQPEHIQWFLLDTSILTRLNLSLCNAVTERTDSESILKQLCAANMFIIALDGKPFWFRYHHMFAEVLHDKLARQEPERLGVLHKRAARWYRKNKMANEAIRHAIAGQDWDYAAELVNKYSAIAIFRGESGTAVRWIRALPESRITGNPYLCITYAWALFLRNLSKFSSMPFHTIEYLLDAAEKFYPQLLASEGPEGSTYKALTAYVDALRVHLAYSRNESREKVIALGGSTLQKFDENNVFIRTNIFFTLALTYLDIGNLDACASSLEAARSAAFVGGFCYQVIIADYFRAYLAKIRGQLRASDLICREGRQSVAQSFVETHRLSAETLSYYDLHQAVLLYEKNHLDQAASMGEKAIEFVRILGETYTLISGFEYLFWIRLSTGADEEEVLSPIAEMEDLSVYCSRARPLAGALRIRYLLCRYPGNDEILQRAFALAEQYGLWLKKVQPGEDRPYPVPFEKRMQLKEQLNLMRLYLAEARIPAVGGPRMSMQEVVECLGVLLSESRQEDIGEYEIEALILLAMAHELLGEDENAINSLRQAICMADSEGYLRIFLDEGSPLVPVLEKSIQAGVCVDYSSKVRDIILSETKVQSDLAQSGRSAVSEKNLSRQERSVLRLIAMGMSNQEIAEELCIAVATVKTHNYNIFKKLDVSSRMAAVEKARRMGIHS
ncbi:MAG: LuxR C-terminal-related transcriptional regulator [Desulfobacteraceae bacterium]|nr:LuxR C-terminal-related transcriptional regulator [Desulfobacteraceae bacterium]